MAMVGVERRPGHSDNISASEPVCPERGAVAALNTTDTAAAAEGEEQYFNWDKRQQRLLLGSYFESNTTAQCCHQAEVIVQSWGPRKDSSTVITFMCTCATTGEGWIR